MTFDTLYVELTVVLGKTHLPLHRALRLGRGAVVALDQTEDDDVVEVLANGHPIGRGRIEIENGAIRVRMIDMVRKPETTRLEGSTVAGHFRVESRALEMAALG